MQSLIEGILAGQLNIGFPEQPYFDVNMTVI